ncbi:MAG: DUF2147 domain-containing protein [Bacteroidota bacterium]
MMIKIKTLVPILSLLLCINLGTSQNVLGKWKTVDDKTGTEKSIVEIYEKDGKIFGKVVEILRKDRKNVKCEDCKGEDKNQPVLGMDIIKNMEKDDDIYENGTITNPENGKVYDCRLKLADNGQLQVRGYVAFFYRTQYWLPVE